MNTAREKIKPSDTQVGTHELPHFLATLGWARPRRLSNKIRARNVGTAHVEAFEIEHKGKPVTKHRLVGMTRRTLASV